MFDNDRLSHWFTSAFLAWVMMFLLLGLPVFHLWLKVPIAKIATFAVLACALQSAITPWLFSARATPKNPSGRIPQRAAAVIVLSTVTALLFFYYLRRSWPDDIETRQFTTIAIGGTLLLGVAALIIAGVVSRRAD